MKCMYRRVSTIKAPWWKQNKKNSKENNTKARARKDNLAVLVNYIFIIG